MRWFYDHLARLVYAKATSWKPVTVGQLQRYVETECEEHTLEGFAGEYILPGGPVHERESAMYADIQSYDDGELAWHEPRTRPSVFGPEESDALRLANAMQRLGMLSLNGLRIVASVWNGTRFSDEQTPHRAEALMQAAQGAGVPVSRVGTFGGDSLKIGDTSASIADLTALYRGSFARQFG